MLDIDFSLSKILLKLVVFYSKNSATDIGSCSLDIGNLFCIFIDSNFQWFEMIFLLIRFYFIFTRYFFKRKTVSTLAICLRSLYSIDKYRNVLCWKSLKTCNSTDDSTSDCLKVLQSVYTTHLDLDG